METPSIKKASTTDIEAAIARALQELTGWETCAVHISAADYGAGQWASGEQVQLTITVRMDNRPEEGLPF